MALIIDWNRIDPPLTEIEKEGAFPIGIALIACGMKEVKADADIREIYLRLQMYGRLTEQTILRDTNAVDCNSLDFWRRWRGVAVNGPRESRRSWILRITDGIFKEMRYEMEKADCINDAIQRKQDASIHA